MQPQISSRDGWATAHTMSGVDKAEVAAARRWGFGVELDPHELTCGGLHFWARN